MLCEFDMRTVDRMFKKTLIACWDNQGNDETGRQIAALAISKKNAEGRCKRETSLSPREVSYSLTALFFSISSSHLSKSNAIYALI